MANLINHCNIDDNYKGFMCFQYTDFICISNKELSNPTDNMEKSFSIINELSLTIIN